jgi:glycosyltransferase involved in cell wall biosynthesis
MAAAGRAAAGRTAMKILVLGFEDHRRPGAGGGSLRNHEVNRRLAGLGHEILVITARFRGSVSRSEDGVRYEHVGLPIGYRPSLLAYQAVLPLMAKVAGRWMKPDVIAEEFSPPWSSLGVGYWAAVPSVGLVHGYFAREKAAQYHFPVRALVAIERWGTRSHRYLVTNSVDVARTLSTAAPRSQVVVCGTGLNHSAIKTAIGGARDRLGATVPGHLVYMGRIEINQKGLDLLLSALNLIRDKEWTLTVAGDGPDVAVFKRMIAGYPWGDRVRLVGRVNGREKWKLLAAAQAVVMPSRYETFGTTALESMASGTPVIAFSIPSLRDTVAPGAGVLVKAFDVAEYAAATTALIADVNRSAAAGRIGMEYSQQASWDLVAAEHERVYEAAISRAEISVDERLRPIVAVGDLRRSTRALE